MQNFSQFHKVSLGFVRFHRYDTPVYTSKISTLMHRFGSGSPRESVRVRSMG